MLRSAATAELRLGIVCYGGVSLAIYMHGVTKELHKLVSASGAFHDAGGTAANPFNTEDTRHAYFAALADLADAGRPLRVTVDVVAGTSAGGINGVCLAKVLAANSSQDALKDLWMEQADFTVLLRPKFFGQWKLRAARAALALLPRWNKPYSPLDGGLMSRLLYQALQDMNAPVDSQRSSLLDPDQSIDLYVTATDLYGENVVVATGAGGASQRETDHAQVLHFRRDADRDDFDTDSAAPLAFAARATSCFPGAFQPVSRRSFLTESGAPESALASIAARFRNRYGANCDGTGYRSDDAWFADGGILDNAPFDLVVRAIGEKRAETEVVRRLVYIQPDPGAPLGAAPAVDHAPKPEPAYLQGTKMGALSVRGAHSFLRELLAIREINLEIETVGELAVSQEKQVEARVAAVWDRDGEPWDIDNLDDVVALGDALYDSAETFIGAGYQAYVRLKVDAAARRMADAVTAHFAYPPDSGHAALARATLSAWVRSRMGAQALNNDEVLGLLGPVDLPYKERRLMFVLAGVNALYGAVGEPDGPTREDLGALKGAAWSLLADVRAAPLAVIDEAPETVEFLRLVEADEFAPPAEFATKHDKLFTALYEAYRAGLQPRFATANALMWRAFQEVTATWALRHRRALLSRVLGFPIWDSLIFPTISLSDLPQFTPIEVAQFSPVAALALAPPPGRGKLIGVGLHHFGAFADRSARENDYLWGRLDGAELVLRTLRAAGSGDSTEPATLEDARAAAGPRLGPALAAVVATESDLTRVTAIDHIREQVASLAD